MSKKSVMQLALAFWHFHKKAHTVHVYHSATEIGVSVISKYLVKLYHW